VLDCDTNANQYADKYPRGDTYPHADAHTDADRDAIGYE
jgi:hypothetical protein